VTVGSRFRTGFGLLHISSSVGEEAGATEPERVQDAGGLASPRLWLHLEKLHCRGWAQQAKHPAGRSLRLRAGICQLRNNER
jgi:hypothetical protein